MGAYTSSKSNYINVITVISAEIGKSFFRGRSRKSFFNSEKKLYSVC